MKFPNGYGSVVKMSGSRRRPFGARVTVGFENGKQKYKYIGYFEKRTDALNALAEYNKAPYELDAVNITFAEIYERYHKDDGANIAQGLLKLHKSAFNHSKELHNVKFKDLRKTHLQSVVNSLKTDTAKVNTIMLFKKLFKYAITNDIATKDYSLTLVAPAKTKKREKVVYTDAEIKKLWSLRGNLNADILLILLYSGMRVNELLKLKKEKINIENDFIITGSKTSAGQNRYIPIHPKIKPIIAEYYKKNNEYLIISNKSKKPIDYTVFYSKRFTPLMDKLGFTHTIHETRHTFITRLYNLGADKLAVKRIVGHADADTTDGYTHVNRSELHKVVNLLDY